MRRVRLDGNAREGCQYEREGEQWTGDAIVSYLRRGDERPAHC